VLQARPGKDPRRHVTPRFETDGNADRRKGGLLRSTEQRGANGSGQSAGAGRRDPGVRADGSRVAVVFWIAAPGMDERRWMECGKQIGRVGNGTSWWIGDWLRYGNAKFGEKYALAARITGYDEQTLMNYVYVAAHVAIPQRHTDVSWSHHAEVAKLDPDGQARWLERIVCDRLSVKDLRLELRAAQRHLAEAQVQPRASAGVRVCPECGRPFRAAPEAAPRGRPEFNDPVASRVPPTAAVATALSR
jgi:hypothetical protein